MKKKVKMRGSKMMKQHGRRKECRAGQGIERKQLRKRNRREKDG